MKKCYLDSNVILSFIDPTAQFHHQAKQILIKLVDEGWEIDLSALVLDECFHNSVRFSKKSRQEALKQLKSRYKKFIKLPNIGLVIKLPQLNRHTAVLNLMAKYSLRSRDAYHLFIMRENKIKYFVTFDNDFEEIFTRGLINKFSA